MPNGIEALSRRYRFLGFRHSYDTFSPSNDHFERRTLDIDCEDMTFHLSVLLNVVLNYNFHQRLEDIDCKDRD